MNAAVRLKIVSSALQEPPYPADTKANGWAPEFHVDRIMSSETWTMAEDDERPWLLRIWLEAWRSVPVGSMPDNRRVFSRRIGCKVAFLEAHSEILMRGWVLHLDGLLYHDFITSQVLDMLGKRRQSAERVSEWRKRRKELEKQADTGSDAENVMRNSGVCNENVPVSNAQEQEQEQDYKREAIASLSPDAAASADAKVKCPHQDIIALYHERLETLPRMVASRWAGSQAERDLRARWNEDARHRDLDFWARFFDAVQGNPHWLGSNDRGWRADLRWLVKRSNFDKVIDRLVNDSVRRSA